MKHSIRLHLFVMALALAVCAFAIASSAAQAQTPNDIPNPGFENLCGGVPCGWTAGPGAVISASTTAYTGSYSMEVTVNADSSSVSTGCLTTSIPSGAPYNVGLYGDALDSNVNQIMIYVSRYSDTSCTNQIGSIGSGGFPGLNTWTKASGSSTTSLAAQSVKIDITILCTACTGGTTTSVLFDDAYAFVSSPPTITASATKADGSPYTAGTWTNQTVTVHYACTPGSAGVVITACTADEVYSADGTFTATGNAYQSDRQTAQVSFGPIQIDKTPPTATVSMVTADGQPYTGAWTNQDVTITITCADNPGGSGLTSLPFMCNTTRTFSSNTAYGESFPLYDNAGNHSGPYSNYINIDKDPPAITASAKTADGKPYSAGTWTNQAVTISYTCNDLLHAGPTPSGVASCPSAQTVSAEGVTPSVTSGTATDNAGNVASGVSFGPIQIDLTAPTITASAKTADGNAYTADTWTNQVVTVHFDCADSASGVADCPADQVFSTDGTFTASGTAKDAAGNSASTAFGPIKLDRTGPTLSPTISPTVAPNTVYLNGTATASPNATDSGTGVASQSCGPVVTSSVGTKTQTCTATDNAGNTTTVTVTYQVIYRFDGFLQPINDTGHAQSCGSPCPLSVFKAGSTVPVKFQLKDANGVIVQSGSLPQWLTPVKGGPITAAVDETIYTDTPSKGSTYRVAGNQYIYNWGTSKSMAGYQWKIGVKLDDGQTYNVIVGLK